MKKYNPKKIEKKWQERWYKDRTFSAKDYSKKTKYYALVEFPYPSGDGLHVGHVRSYAAIDVISRKRRMEGCNVLYPIGWDAFGLPTENYAIKTGIHPKKVTKQNTDTFRRQLKSFGFSFDWEREINTTDPEYYKWTQWMFIQFFKKGLAYKANVTINWCPSCKIGLANEEVIQGKCERCDHEVNKKEKEQWMLKITEYADKLLEGLEEVDYIPQAKLQQENWIGKSEGALIKFSIASFLVSGEVVFATNNRGKVARIQKLFKAANLPIIFKMPEEVGIRNFDVSEDGKTLFKNAEKKARALAKLTSLPVFADDSGFFIDGAEIDPITVKRNALLGADEKSLSVLEIAARMQKYYQDIASSRGGKVDAEWRNAFCFITPEKFALHAESVRPVVLTDKLRGKIDPYLPLRGLYISKITGKHVLEQTEDEELRELEPITEAIEKLVRPLIQVFTTRPDTLFGVTYIVLAPEHSIISNLKSKISNLKAVENYIEKAKKKTDLQRQEESREKTGVELKGVKAINPATKEEIPIWVADYVLISYGTGAIMAVPAHDARDYEFAKKFNLPIKKVILPKPLAAAPRNAEDIAAGARDALRVEAEVWTGEGEMVNSGKFDGMSSEKAKWEITKFVEGKKEIRYRLRDWIFSRQRYWGEPIPLVNCGKCGWIPVKDKNLPVELPNVKRYKPTDTGESPLAEITNWVNVKCPKCGSGAKRETDVMPNWAGSSWYFLRYLDPKNDKQFASFKKLKHWMPVDLYNGGMEHTVLHLLYSRFWNMFLYDIGVSPVKEPYNKRISHGMILGKGGIKMSKSKGNVVNPDDIVKEFGADSLRLYEMFIGPFNQYVVWDSKGLVGMERFLKRLWALFQKSNIKNNNIKLKNERAEKLLHKTIKKVTEEIENFRFNTAISALMILLNQMEKSSDISVGAREDFLKLLHPFAPHITQELWSQMGNESFLDFEAWPKYDKNLIKEDNYELMIQINGKLRDSVLVKQDISEAEAEKAAFAREKIKKALGNKKPKRVVFVKNRLINLVI